MTPGALAAFAKTCVRGEDRRQRWEGQRAVATQVAEAAEEADDKEDDGGLLMAARR